MSKMQAYVNLYTATAIEKHSIVAIAVLITDVLLLRSSDLVKAKPRAPPP